MKRNALSRTSRPFLYLFLALSDIQRRPDSSILARSVQGPWNGANFTQAEHAVEYVGQHRSVLAPRLAPWTSTWKLSLNKGML